MPYVLKSLLGTGATSGLLVLIFMAITSTVSSSMIAVSSIISLDFFRTYVNPRASDRKTLQVSHIGVVFHGCFMAGFAIMLQYAGATNNWSTYFRPIVATPGIFPMILALLWSRQTKLAAIIAPLLGLCCGLTVWLTLSWHYGGTININTTQLQLPGLYGAITSFFSPLLFSIIISLLRPSRFDWREYLKIDLIEDKSAAASSSASSTGVEINTNEVVEKKAPIESLSATSPEQASGHGRSTDLDNVVHPFNEQTLRHIKWWGKFAAIYFVVNVLVTIVLWPMPLYRDWIFTKPFFEGWVTVALIWQWLTFFTVVVFPVYDGRHAISKVLHGILADRRWRRK